MQVRRSHRYRDTGRNSPVVEAESGVGGDALESVHDAVADAIAFGYDCVLGRRLAFCLSGLSCLDIGEVEGGRGKVP